VGDGTEYVVAVVAMAVVVVVDDVVESDNGVLACAVMGVDGGVAAQRA
jgi:hypothetical protein